jgi:hypothetical protein
MLGAGFCVSEKDEDSQGILGRATLGRCSWAGRRGSDGAISSGHRVMVLAGIPMAVAPLGTSLFTTAFAPILA